MTGVSVVLALGSNLGDRFAHLCGAVAALAADPGFRGLRVSSVYETAPVGGPPQEPYLNAVVIARTVLSPSEVLARAQTCEAAARRVRGERWGPRTLDVDVVAVGPVVSDDPSLTLPHPRAHGRAFVLVPWLELDAGAVLPGRGLVSDLVAQGDVSGVHRRDDLEVPVP